MLQLHILRGLEDREDASLFVKNMTWFVLNRISALNQSLWCVEWNPVAFLCYFCGFDDLTCRRCFPEDLLEDSHMRLLCLFSWWSCPHKPLERLRIWQISDELESCMFFHLTVDFSWLGPNWGLIFELEDAHEVFLWSPKFGFDPLSESRVWMFELRELTCCYCSNWGFLGEAV